MKRTISIGLIVLLYIGEGRLSAQKFYLDDPIWVDLDRLDTPVKPEEVELSDLYDRFGHMFYDFGTSEIGSEALNVNTLDEVPDSSWFTNRHGVEQLSIESLKRGPNRGSGPNPDGKWIVFRGKSQGLTPGFQIKDETGDRYVIKFDPVGIPDLASAAEVIATKIFYAAGYNVPENHIVRFGGETTIEPGTMVEDRFGDQVPLTEFRFERMVRKVARLPDGRIRLLASKYLDGTPIGPFRYYGTRSDDPNDVISHEDRRELRGLKLFAAWTNHDDSRAHNTQDSWVEENGQHYVRHYLMDFGSTFGSGSVQMQAAHLGFGDTLGNSVKKNFLGFGFHVPRYRQAHWPEFPEYQSVGRWEGELFDPADWENEYPNPAFVRMTPRDAFWAAKIIMQFTSEELAAIVESGEYGDEKLSKYFLEVLIQRQQKCGKFGINGVNPLAEFRVNGNILEFANLSARYGFDEASTRYRLHWSVHDSRDGSNLPLKGPIVQDTTRVELPIGDDYHFRGHCLLTLEIVSLNEAHRNWAAPIRVYLRSSLDGYRVVGIERKSEPEKNPED